jgi:hypothetical protein
MIDSSIAELVKQRSMLVVLIAACSTAQSAFEASEGAVDDRLLSELSTMIDLSEAELAKLSQRIEASLN